MKITFNDISKRIKNKYNFSSNGVTNVRVYTESNVFCKNNVISGIKNWQNLDETSNEAFNKALDLFEELCLNENESISRTYCNYLIENVDKVRDAVQLKNSLKNRNGRLKKKNVTKLHRNFEPVTTAISDSINKINSALPSSPGVASPNSSSGNVATECFNMITDKVNKVIACDRIIENYSKVSRRFNLDKIITEEYDDMYTSSLRVAKCMDTYNMNFEKKYSIALEMCYYLFNKHNMNCPSNTIVEGVTDYFIFSSVLNESNIDKYELVRDNIATFNRKDFLAIDNIIYDDDVEYDYPDIDCEIQDYCDPITESFKKKKKEIKKAVRGLERSAKKGNPDERVSGYTRRQISKFRKECLKDPDNKNNNVSKLKSILVNVFAKSPYEIVNELPNVFVILRAMIVVGSTAINPILGLITFITSSILKLNLSRKQTEKIVKAYQKEIDLIEGKIEKAKTDGDKEDLEKYLDELNKDYKKLKEYENNLYTYDENDDRDTSTSYGKNAKSDLDDFDFDFDWDDDDFDFDLEESANNIIQIADYMTSISESLIDDNVDGIVCKNVFKLDNDALDTITDFSVTVPVILEKDKLREAFEEYRDELRKQDHTFNNYMRIDRLNENIYRLKENNNTYGIANDLESIKCYLSCLNEIVNINSSKEYIMELNFTNTLKLSMDRLRKTATKLKDKEKKISNNVDMAVNNVSKGMETALMNDNREAVINGKILPSASKCIKIACVEGLVWAFSPAMAVITALGMFACNKRLQTKERQLIMDDIDIELKMVDRYIRQAEDENDMKKLRQLEMLKRNLLRQQQRIRYKVHVVYNDSVPNINDED